MSTGTPRQAPSRSKVPQFCGMSGSNRTMRITRLLLTRSYISFIKKLYKGIFPMNKYDRLGAFLREQGREYVPMTFVEIERIVGVKLPKSQKYQAWWSNSTSNNMMTQVWLGAGYRTEQVDVARGQLVFRRVAVVDGIDAPHTTEMQEETPMFRSDVQAAPSGGRNTRHPASG